MIGTATIHTPVLKSPLSGPAYLVSHGNAAFPDVEFVLQGEGITLVVDGQTEIKNGITYSKFETAPDAPFTTFETVLPAGPKSVLAVYNAANTDEPYSACGIKLAMPTTIISQSNKLIETETPIATTGCSGVKSNKIHEARPSRSDTPKPSKPAAPATAQQAARARANGKCIAAYTAKALAACHYSHRSKERRTCETHARRQYAAGAQQTLSRH